MSAVKSASPEDDNPSSLRGRGAAARERLRRRAARRWSNNTNHRSDVAQHPKAEALGIVISYSIGVKLNCGTLGGELVTDVPFKLMHPTPGAIERENVILKKSKSIERARYENSCYANDDNDNIFEDFARLRLNEPE